MSHAKHRAPCPSLPTATVTVGPLALAALALVTAPAAQALVPTGTASSTPQGTPAGSGTTYVVRAGDTLASIARSQGVAGGWQALATANRVSRPDAIYPGRRLVIPGSGSTGSTAGGSTGSTAPVASGSSTAGSTTVDFARTFTGVPYRWGGTSRSGVDCSGLTSLVLRHAGQRPPRTAAAQYGWAQKISASQARPGDLVFGYFSGGRPGHVGIYVGGGKMIDAPTFGQVVGVHRVSGDARYGRPPSRA